MDGALLEQDTIRYDSLFGAITPIWKTAKCTQQSRYSKKSFVKIRVIFAQFPQFGKHSNSMSISALLIISYL